MKILKYVLGAALALFVLINLGQIVASESAEVVVLTSQGEGGAAETRLWVVEHGGLQYLRAGPDSGWYLRLLAEPEVSLARAGSTAAYHAETRLELRADLNRRMREKYGWRDVYIEWLIGGRDDAVPVALIPMT